MKPQIIRADTLDLQDQISPSAKDHTRQPTHPGALGDGPPAPHQAVALRNAGHDGFEHHARSPRVSQDLSGKELQLLHEPSDQKEVDGGVEESHGNQNDGADGEDGDLDAEGDDSLEDDMMDKISSSPSIDDGGYSTPLFWPDREDSLFSMTTPKDTIPHNSTAHDIASSSPFLSTPIHFPLSLDQEEPDLELSEDHHQQGRYTDDRTNGPSVDDNFEDEDRDQLAPLVSERTTSSVHEGFETLPESYDAGFEDSTLHHLLLPEDDPLLDNSFDDAYSTSSSGSSSPVSIPSWDGQSPEMIDDDTEDISFLDESRFVDSGWGGECLRETEDIDFEFVYALHTFVATVEGQANATKGDTMVLLDDSNSYWWLVRVVKDNSIGYLPAEHIETPTERLARLNKHRNIDLSQTMLGDNPEKSKNPLKKAMRRRNAKTVTFSAPTYVEASDVDYSTDEEGDEEGIAEGVEPAEAGEPESQQAQDKADVVEPLKVRGQATEDSPIDDIQSSAKPEDNNLEQTAAAIVAVSDKPRTSDEIFEHQDDGPTSKSRKGTVRNTDSFFKDDSVETRKINLTPSLLRDDSSSSTLIPSESKDLKTRPSLDILEKVASPTEKTRDDKKRKDKKSGMLSGLFKRKDRKNKTQNEDGDDAESPSEEVMSRSPQPKESSESLSRDQQGSKITSPAHPQRHTSKLQKAPPAKLFPQNKTAPLRGDSVTPRTILADQARTNLPPSDRPSPSTSGKVSPMSMDDHSAEQSYKDPPSPLRNRTPEPPREQSRSPSSPRAGVFSDIRDVLRSSPSSEVKPEKVKKAKQRVAMDDFDSSPDTEEHLESIRHREEDRRRDAEEPTKERLSESPVQVSPQEPSHPANNNPPGLIIDTSSQEEPSFSPVSPSSTPELVEAPHEDRLVREETPASTAQSSSTAPPTWSDADLRTYLEDDSDIRDLLVVVHDKSDVKPAGPDHPIVGKLFQEENRRLGDISHRLDGLLNDWLARKSSSSSSSKSTLR